MKSERGSALVIAVLLMAILTLLGVSYLFIADTENRIAENEKLSAQAYYFGEGVTREVKRWFDRPPYSAAGATNLSRPTTSVMDRMKRRIDVDGPGPAPEELADGSPLHPYYKGGVDRDADGNDDVFDKPYRPDPADMFLGTAEWPDIHIDRADGADVATFLDALSEKIMPGFPAGAVGVSARVKTIDVYAPPYLDTGGGTWVRYGVATVSTRVQILRDPGGPTENVMADRMIIAVLNETPLGGVFGPLHSCDELGWANEFRVHWGPATAASTASLPIVAGNGMSLSIPRDVPASPKADLLHGHLLASDPTWDNLVAGLEGDVIDDPWFSFFAGLSVQNWGTGGSPQVVLPGTGGQDDSNRFQNYPNVPCPAFNYDTWKSIAKSGGSDVHYYAWDSGTKFREGGTGSPEEFVDATDDKTGLFFFDTLDGLPPHDFDAGGVALNLTPEIRISASPYGTRGLIYLNTKMWRVDGSPGRPAQFTFPGEPFRDENENGIREGTEPCINLNFSDLDAIDSTIRVAATDGYGSTAVPPIPFCNDKGPTVSHDAIVWGILYLAGQFDASGTPFYNGSVVTYAGTETNVKTVGTASLYWDPTIRANWPPPDWNMPRVIITQWHDDEYVKP